MNCQCSFYVDNLNSGATHRLHSAHFLDISEWLAPLHDHHRDKTLIVNHWLAVQLQEGEQTRLIADILYTKGLIKEHRGDFVTVYAESKARPSKRRVNDVTRGTSYPGLVFTKKDAMLKKSLCDSSHPITCLSLFFPRAICPPHQVRPPICMV